MDQLRLYFIRVAGHGVWIFPELIFIGLVVYWVVDFLEGTRGERLFRAVIFILIVGFLVLKLVVGLLPLERLQYLYKGFLVGVLIIAVAAFQPEVRRALMRIGQSRFLSSASLQLSRTVEELVAAVVELSAVRIGAIIVIERRVALGEFIETGVRIDARVTAALIRTIFQPGTALHDMAVLIRGDRIVAARVQLPLAEAVGMDSLGLGSRHRAAMGITTGSDAVCVVVSEETGVISIAENGKLTRNLDETTLKRHLTGALS
ncbi:MAG: TIGR00159 family protein [Planctomycetes bacterium RBG_16_55_9]|nr:MAG: TIGR00159 family protein [Planctomycetes bacterium RBG_16_55_9]